MAIDQKAQVDNVPVNIVDIIARINDTFSLDIDVFNVDVAGVKTDFDFTGFTGLMQVKSKDTDSDVVLLFDTTDSTIIFSGNTVQLRQDAADMDIRRNNYTYDFQVTSGTGERTTLFGGDFKVNQDVTR